jgi:anaphase-promoting complex subunit 5
MLHRLHPGQKPPLNEIQPHLEPLEVLFDVKKLLDEQNEQPTTAAFTKLCQALGLYDHWADTHPSVPLAGQQWAHHAVQSHVWNAAGGFHHNQILGLIECRLFKAI